MLATVYDTFRVDEYGLSRHDVPIELEAERIQRDALRGNHAFWPVVGTARPEHERAYAVRVPEGDDTEADNHRDDGVTAGAAPVHGFDSRENCIGCQATVRQTAELVGEDVEQYLGIRAGVQMTPVTFQQEPLELLGIDEITVMREADAVR